MASAATTPGEPITDESHWEGVWRGIQVTDGSEVFEDRTFDAILSKYLPVSTTMRAIELGCVPGSYMLYLHRRYGYRVSGLDFLDRINTLRPNLTALGVVPEKLIKADFLTADIGDTWNVVASFGLIEHFRDTEFVLERHCNLVAPGGYLVVQLPHFRGAQYILQRLFNNHVLPAHNLDSMRPKVYRRYLERRGYEVLTCNYFRTFDFWATGANNPLFARRALSLRIAYHVSHLTKKVLQATGLAALPNPVFSPYIVVVARRPE
jgi:trans-aconitate methyltransferase